MIVRAATTAEVFARLPDCGRRTELVRGEVVEMSPPSAAHGVVAVRIAAALLAAADRAGAGIVGVESGFVLERDPDTVRGPDAYFVRAERLIADHVPAMFWAGAPDIAVEVLSPWDRPGVIAEKAAEYIATGAQLVWVADPQHQTVTVYRPHRPARVLSKGDRLDAGTVLPGLSVIVGDLFP